MLLFAMESCHEHDSEQLLCKSSSHTAKKLHSVREPIGAGTLLIVRSQVGGPGRVGGATAPHGGSCHT